jgi:hypothetical protein
VTASYTTDRTAQRERRELLDEVRARLGDRLFADLMVDMIAGSPALTVGNLPSLVDVWLVKQRLAS